MNPESMEQAGLFAPGERDRINRYVAAELLAWAQKFDDLATSYDGDTNTVAKCVRAVNWNFAADLQSRAFELSPPNPDDRAEIEARLAELSR